MIFIACFPASKCQSGWVRILSDVSSFKAICKWPFTRLFVCPHDELELSLFNTQRKSLKHCLVPCNKAFFLRCRGFPESVMLRGDDNWFSRIAGMFLMKPRPMSQLAMPNCSTSFLPLPFCMQKKKKSQINPPYLFPPEMLGMLINRAGAGFALHAESGYRGCAGSTTPLHSPNPTLQPWA